MIRFSIKNISKFLFLIIFLQGLIIADNNIVKVGINRLKDPFELELTLPQGGIIKTDNNTICEKITPYSVKIQAQKNGNVMLIPENKEYNNILVKSNGQITVRNTSNNIEYKYGGELDFSAKDGIIQIINLIDVNEYLISVVSSEMGENAPLEALKAQAVASRTYLLKNMRKHQAEGFDVCDSRIACCQVYKGYFSDDRIAREAVNETDGLALFYDNKPIEAFFSNCCGGETCGIEAVFPGSKPLPYLKGVKDGEANSKPFCFKDDRFNWQQGFKEEILCSAFDDKTKGKVDVESDKDGNILYFKKGNERISVLLFRKRLAKLGFNGIDSNYFTMQEKDGIYTFKWHGFGHRIGMCQAGAIEMARQGMKFDTILTHYYLAELKQVNLEEK